MTNRESKQILKRTVEQSTGGDEDQIDDAVSCHHASVRAIFVR